MSMPFKSFTEIFNSGFWEGQQKFTDGKLQTEDGATFRIHRVVLSQRSGYFRALFSFNLNQETVGIPKVDSKVLESILLYIYTGIITLEEKNVWDILIASDYLLLDDLLEHCRSFTIRSMTTTNCLSSLAIASKIDRLGITDDSYRYTLVHFEEALQKSNGELEELPFEIFNKLLKSYSLNVASERSVWKAIVSWTNNSTKLSHVPELLTSLKLVEEADEGLAAEILSHTIVNDNPYCIDLMLRKQFNYYMTKCTLISQYARSEGICCTNSPILYHPRMPNRMYLIARHTLTHTKYGSELFLTYDNELDFWRQVGEAEFFIDTMVQIGPFIYMFNVWQNINLVFDIVEEAWIPIAITALPSHNCWVIALGEQLFSIGGIRDNRELTDIIFSYDFERDRWNSILMPHNILVYGAVVLRDLIYIMGMTESSPVLIFQAYNPEDHTWMFLPPPNIYRGAFSVVAYHEQVFVIAGVNDGQYLKCVEVYDPTQNTWTSFPDLPFQYFFPRAVILDDKIIVYENNNEDTRYYEVSPPVYWDKDAHIWRIIDESSPLHCIERCSFFVLDDNQFVQDITAKNRRPGIKWKQFLHV